MQSKPEAKDQLVLFYYWGKTNLIKCYSVKKNNVIKDSILKETWFISKMLFISDYMQAYQPVTTEQDDYIAILIKKKKDHKTITTQHLAGNLFGLFIEDKYNFF